MRRVLVPTLLAIFAMACQGVAAGAPDPADRGAAFDRYWSDFDRTYPSFPLKGVDWRGLRDSVRRQAVAAGSTEALIEILRSMTARLRDGHARLLAPDGTTRPTWTPDLVVNWDRAQWLASLPALGFVQVRPNLGYAQLADGIGYVVFGSWNPQQVSVAEADALLDRFRTASALIVDVRMNGGGDDRVAFDVAGRFLSQPRSAGSVQTRNGAAHDALGAPVMISVRPRGTRLAMPVVLLTGRGVFSSSESFVDAMRQEPSVLTLGDTTGGSSGNPVLRPFIDGWQYTVPTWQHRASDGTLIEGHGIPPERHVPWDADAARVGRDVVLESAVALLRAGRAGGAGP